MLSFDSVAEAYGLIYLCPSGDNFSFVEKKLWTKFYEKLAINHLSNQFSCCVQTLGKLKHSSGEICFSGKIWLLSIFVRTNMIFKTDISISVQAKQFVLFFH